MKKAYLLIVLFLCGLSAGNIFAAAPAAGRLGEELLDAAKRGDETAVKELIAAEVDVDARDDYGHTPLMGAAHEGHTDIVDLLLQKGAEIDATNRHGRTALMLTATKGHKNIVKQLLDKKAEVDATDMNGGTALMYAATIHNDPEIVKQLLDHGADKTLQNAQGHTAESLARLNEYEDLANYIRDYTPSGRLTKRAR